MTPKDVLKEIEKKAKTQRIPFIGPKKGKVLVKEIKKRNPKNLLEVGTNIGYSAILMGNSIKNKKAKLTSVEIDPDIARRARKNIRRAGLQKTITIKVGPAKTVIPGLKGHFDLLFLDAVKEEYIDYLKLAEQKLTKGAVVIADNVGVFRYALKDYLKYVKSSPLYESSTKKFDEDAVEVSVKQK